LVVGSLVVAGSVLVHGATATPLSHAYDRFGGDAAGPTEAGGAE
jgi:hypothetical protein